MIGFLIKKTFFDLWDNLLKLAAVNIGFIASLAFLVFIPPLLASIPLLAILASLMGILWLAIYFQAAALSLKTVSDYSSFGVRDFFHNIKEGWKPGLVLGGLVSIMWLMASMIIPFYLDMGSLLGLFLAAVIFWALAIGVLALQFFFAIRSRLDTKPLKIIKKCFLIFFDNAGFSLFSFIHNLVLLVISVLTAFLIPGPAGVLLYLDEALRLRLLKYDWLETNPPEAAANGRRKRPQIPWDALLIDDREKTGTRSLRNFIFPWKD
ncbi:MAG: hypothetical protein LBT11_04840 [Treponema sp.]|jgi:hypothetical protein|nr:hypothetical protein [Treponema sp.]